MAKKPIKAHAIQLVDVYPTKLFIGAAALPDRDVGITPSDIAIQIGVSDIEEEADTAKLFVSVHVKTKDELQDKLPFEMDFELAGLFSINTNEFDKEQIDDWVQRGSMYILLPYVREYIYWLTYRCGFKPLILPLAQVPTIKYKDLGKQKQSQ